MDEVGFTRLIVDEAFRPAVLGTVAHLEDPPGSRPAADLASASVWYQRLNEPDQEFVSWVAAAAAHAAIFHVLSLIDGETSSEFDRYELVGIRRGSREIVNPGLQSVPLHDEFQAMVMTDEGTLRLPKG